MKISFTAFWLVWGISWISYSVNLDDWAWKIATLVIGAFGTAVVAVRIDEGRKSRYAIAALDAITAARQRGGNDEEEG